MKDVLAKQLIMVSARENTVDTIIATKVDAQIKPKKEEFAKGISSRAAANPKKNVLLYPYSQLVIQAVLQLHRLPVEIQEGSKEKRGYQI